MKNLKFIFGPAPSRRLGRSLGINIVPSKVCSMDCIYCEAGKTKGLTVKRAEYYNAQDIINEFKDNFYKFKDITDVITITGAGEPTLNSALDKILEGVKGYAMGIPIAILTNATMLFDKNVYDTLLKFDIVVPSFDGASEDVIKLIDKPHESISADSLRNNLLNFSKDYTGKLFLEILLCKGINDGEKEIKLMANCLSDFKITKIQLGTVTRPPALNIAQPVSKEKLEEAAKILFNAGLPVEITSSFAHSGSSHEKDKELPNKITALVKLRPCTLSDIIGVFGITEQTALDTIESLTKEKEIVSKDFNGETYFSHPSLAALKDKD